MAEIHAANVAINQAGRLGIQKLRIHTDAKVVVEAVNGMISVWRKNNWLNVYNQQPIANRRDYEALEDAIRRNKHIEIEFKHVDGHSGNANHNAAHHLARKGAENR